MGTQAKRPQQSPADQLAEAEADVQRLAQKLYEALSVVGLVQRPTSWHALAPMTQHYYRGVVRLLLGEDVIRVGQRPNIERPMEGQLSIDD